jgi:hypothetical protein
MQAKQNDIECYVRFLQEINKWQIRQVKLKRKAVEKFINNHLLKELGIKGVRFKFEEIYS